MISELITYLPGISNQYWERYLYEITPSAPVLVKSGQTTSVLPSSVLNKRGIIHFTSMTTNSPNGSLVVTVDGRSIKADMQQMFKAGAVGIEDPNLPYILQWNTTQNIYSIQWNPEQPFNNDVTIQFTNSGNSDMYILAFIVQLYILKPGFYEQYSKLKYSAIINELEVIKNAILGVEKLTEEGL
ncbi:MAG: hypothetical protein QW203_06190 [Thermoplasmatales archaeon]